jgi:hypothetical protein
VSRLLLGKDIGDDAARIAGPWPAMSDPVAPLSCLPVAFGQRSKAPPGPEGIANITDGPFHAPFLIARPHLARLRGKVVVGAQLGQARVEQDVRVAALQHRRLEVVVKNGARLSVPSLKGMHVAAQEVLGALIEEELQVERARVRQRDDKAGKSALCAADADVAEVCPIDLRLLVMVCAP